jgi:RimJ/RimL family protein N-acetyltransferase
MLERIVDYARARGIEKIHGDVLASNTTMLKLCEVLGFTVSGTYSSKYSTMDAKKGLKNHRLLRQIHQGISKELLIA